MGKEESRTTEYVILVHGSFAADENDAKCDDIDRWWQRGSDFTKALVDDLDQTSKYSGSCIDYKVAPSLSFSDDLRPWWAKIFGFESARSSESVDQKTSFHWSGSNSEAERRQAGKRLYDYFQTIEAEISSPDAGGQIRGYHVVAHSHGGIVTWGALCEATRNGNELKNLKSWTTVGTPFLRFKPDWKHGFVYPLISILLLIGIFWRQFDWWNDFWRQAVPEWPGSPWVICVAYLLAGASFVTLPALFLRTLWSMYCWWNLSDLEGTPDRYELERWDFYSSLLALVGFAACVVVGYRILMYQPAIYNAIIDWKTLQNWQVLLGVLWTVGALASGLFCAAWICSFLWQWRRAISSDNTSNKTWATYGPRYLVAGEAASGIDEAINGLRVLRWPVEGELLPRFALPRTKRYTRKSALVNPENEQLRQGFIRSVMHFSLLPLAILWNWVVQPVYNEVIARMIDEYVLDRLRKNLIGDDIWGLELDKVSIHPHSLKLPVSGENALADPTRVAISKRVAERAGDFLGSVRGLLGHRWEGSVEFDEFFRRAMAGRDDTKAHSDRKEKVFAGASDILVHTNYFAIPNLRRQIVTKVANVPGELKEFAVAPDKFEHRQIGPPRLSEMCWWLLRKAAWLAIVLLPLEVLAYSGTKIAYPYSTRYVAEQALALVPGGTAVKQSIVGIANAAAVNMIDDATNGPSRKVLTGYCAAARLFDSHFDITDRIADLKVSDSTSFIFHGTYGCCLFESHQFDDACNEFGKCLSYRVDPPFYGWLMIKLNSALACKALDDSTKRRLVLLVQQVRQLAANAPLESGDAARVDPVNADRIIRPENYISYLKAAAEGVNDTSDTSREVAAVRLRRVLNWVADNASVRARINKSGALNSFETLSIPSRHPSIQSIAYTTQVARMYFEWWGDRVRALRLLDSLNRSIAADDNDRNYDSQVALLALGYLDIGCVNVAHELSLKIQRFKFRALASQGFLLAELKLHGNPPDVLDAIDPFYSFLGVTDDGKAAIKSYDTQQN